MNIKTGQDKDVVLLVDDEPELVSALTTALSVYLTWKVIGISDSRHAAEILQEQKIAVLVCDMNMPGPDGNAILRLARSHNPDTVSIIITAGTDMARLIDAVNFGGIWKYLHKPFDFKQLVQLVQEAMQLYKVRTAAAGPAPRLPTARPRTAGRASPPTPIPHARHQPRPVSAVPHRPDIKPKPVAIKPGIIEQRYRTVALIASGGAADVYRAEDTLLDMPVAIKILHREFTSDAETLAQLISEARIAMQLSHKHIVRLHNLQETQGQYYLVMEYINGDTLRTLLQQQGKLPLDTVVQIAEICADALGYAHRHGVLHRDLKPDNLMLNDEGILKIVDFGLACLTNVRKDPDYICGTPCYMSPEEIRGEPIDPRTDIYSLGVTLYELATGHMPLVPGQPNDGVDESAKPPAALQPVFAKALSPEPTERWEDVHAFAEALRRAAGK
ncbi:MAG: protein kinase [Kiritimatiellia bacterium]|nr:protein kinase [Lentisphaerota bacterium]